MQNCQPENQSERPKPKFRNSVCGYPQCCNCPEKGPRPRFCPCAGNKNYKDYRDCTNSNCARDLPITTCTNYKYDLWNYCNENPQPSDKKLQCFQKPSLVRDWKCAERKKRCKEGREVVPHFDWKKENLCDFSDVKNNANNNINICNNNNSNINGDGGESASGDYCYCWNSEEAGKGNGNTPKPKKYNGWAGRVVYDECREQRNYTMRFTTNGLYGRGYNNFYSTVCGKPRCCVDSCQGNCCDLYGPCLNDKY